MEDKLPKMPGQEKTESNDNVKVLVDIEDTTFSLSKADALMVAGRILATIETMERNGN